MLCDMWSMSGFVYTAGVMLTLIFTLVLTLLVM